MFIYRVTRYLLSVSLAPHEQQALARIEDSLAGSDPRLATMLATFTLPVAGRMAARGLRLARSQRARWLAVVVLTLATVTLAIAAWLTISPSSPAACPRQPARSIAPLSVSTCGPSRARTR
jgi:hypothetical protein